MSRLLLVDEQAARTAEDLAELARMKAGSERLGRLFMLYGTPVLAACLVIMGMCS